MPKRTVPKQKQTDIKPQGMLQGNTRMLAALIEHGRDNISLLDAEGRLLWESPSANNMLGYRPDEFAGKDIFSLVHPDDLGWIQELFRKVALQPGHVENGTFRLRHRDGSWRWAEASAINRLNDPDIGATIINYRDVTDQMLANETLRESQRRLESLFENSPIPLWEEDFSEVKNYLKKLKLSGKPADIVLEYIQRHPGIVGQCVEKVRIIGVNRACLTLHNAKDKASLLAGLGALVTEESRDALQRQIVAIATGQTEIELDSMAQTLDGRPRHVHVHWSVVPGYEETLERVIVSIEDVSDRKEMEEALNASEKRFRSLIENNHDAIALLDARGRLLYESPSGLQITGYTLEERVGGSGLDLLHPDDLEKVRRLLGQIVQKPQAVVNTQVRSRRKDGEWRWLDVTAVNLLEDRAVGAIVINYRDITESKEAEAALAKAERVQKLLLESVGEGIHGLDIEGRIMFENAASLKMFGWEAEEMLGRNAHVVMHHHHADGSVYPVEECPIYRTLADGKTRRVENEAFFRKDGTSFPVEYTCSVMKDDGIITGVVVSFRDITERKQAEAALCASEERYRMLFDLLPYGGEVLDTKGNIITCSPSTARMLGYETSEIAGRHILDFIEPGSPAMFRGKFPKLLSGQPQEAEIKMTRKDGTTLHVLRAASPLFDETGRVNGVLAVSVDISQRVEAEKALKDSKERFRALTEATSEGVVFHDQGLIVDVNPALVSMFGYANASELVGRGLLEFIAPESQENVLKQVQSGGVQPYEAFGLRKDGSVFPVETSARVYEYRGRRLRVASIRDITERKKIEDNIQREKAFSEAIINSMPGIFYLFDETGQFLRWNKNFGRVSGYSGEEISAMRPTDFFTDPEKEYIRQRVEQVFAEGVSDAEADFMARDGTRRPFYFTGVRVELNGKPCLLGVGVDITERRRAEKLLRNLSLAVNHSGDVVFMTDRQGIITSINSQFTEQYGHDPEEIVGKTTPRILKSGAQGTEVYEKFWQTIVNGEMFRGRVINKARDGSLIHVEETVSPFMDEEGNVAGFLAIQRNVTERDQAEQALIKSEKDYRHLFNNASDAILIFEMTNETILQVNAAACSLYGFRYEEIVGKSLMDLTKNVERGQAYIGALQAGKASSSFESVHRNSKGKEIQVLISASVIEYQGQTAVLAIIRDITERKRAEDEIRQRLVELQTLYENSLSINRLTDTHFIGLQIIQSLEKNMDWHNVAIRLRGEDDNKLELIAFNQRGMGEAERVGVEQRYSAAVSRISQGLSGWVIRNRKALRTGNVHEHPDYVNVDPAIQSGLYAPLLVGERVIGSISVESEQVDAFNANDERLLVTLASQAAIAFENARLYQAVQKELTERKQAEDRIQKQISRLKAMHDVDRAITSGFDLPFSLKELLKHTTVELGVDAASILLLNPNLNTLEYANGHGFRTKGIERSNLRLDEGHAGRAAMQRVPVRIPNLDEHPEQFVRASLLAGEGFVCYFGVPLIAKGIVNGVLEVFHRSPLEPDQEWLDFLHTLAGQAAIAIQDAQLFNNLQASTLELLLAYDSTIEGWSRALDLRDKETEGHTLRVTDMALRLGQKFGLRDEELKYMRWGGLLHDIGKMGVPDAILLKPEGLTPEEWKIMRMHPTYAHQMLSPIQYLKPALDIPYCHHERWDGTGYPRGLKGEEIPLAARIFAVADVYDALTSDRPYRNQWNQDEVMEYIRSHAGSHFDPRVVGIFLKMVEDGFPNEPPG